MTRQRGGVSGSAISKDTLPDFILSYLNPPTATGESMGAPKKVRVSGRGRSPSESPPQRSGVASLLLKARGMGEEVRGRLSGHGFSTEASLLICGSKAAGVPRGMAPLVAGRSPRRGGRERSDRWKGESRAFSLQRDAAGNERADESHTLSLSPSYKGEDGDDIPFLERSLQPIRLTDRAPVLHNDHMRLRSLLSRKNLPFPLRGITQPPKELPQADIRGKVELQFASAEQVAKGAEKLDLDFAHRLALVRLTLGVQPASLISRLFRSESLPSHSYC